MEASRIRGGMLGGGNICKKFRVENYVIVYLDETWFDSHQTVRMIWTDNTAKCSKGNRQKEKRVTIMTT